MEFFELIQALFMKALDIFFHLDSYLIQGTQTMGGWLYVILFLVIFCETGLVVAPFLPGDSLLFAVGAITALDGSPLHIGLIILCLGTAGIIGDAVNYSVGYRVGPKVFHREDSLWLSKKHLLRAQQFYEKYGGKTIIFARFIPIVRTFAPFVAGIGQMKYRRFALFNFTGAIAWVVTFSMAGYRFGNIPQVKRNFQWVIVAIIILSILPAVIEYYREHRRTRPPAVEA